MAITIIQKKKRQRYLILVLALIIFSILFVVWFGFLRERRVVSEPSPSEATYVMPKVEIDWQTLDELQEENLSPFKEIGAFKGDFGRKNPFIPY